MKNDISYVFRNNKFIQIALFVVVLIVVYIAYKQISKLINKAEIKIQQSKEEQMIEQVVGVEQKTLTDYQIKTFADTLFTAMDGVGTDNEAIYKVFNQVNNTADLMALIKAFSIKKYTGGFIDWGNSDMSLVQWLHEELSKSEIEKLNNILRNKDIQFVI